MAPWSMPAVVHAVLLRRQRRHVAPVGHVLIAVLQPARHQADLVTLRDLHAQAHLLDRAIAGACVNQGRHLQRLRVVMNHALHERDIGLGKGHALDFGQILSIKGSCGLARSPRLHNAGT